MDIKRLKKEIIIRLTTLENDLSFQKGIQKKQITPQQKSLEKARNLREEGNRIYATCRSLKDFYNVYEFYAQSIAHAPANSQEIALAYSNLSAVLLRLDKHSECLQAIDCCLNSGYPEKSKFKIYLRKIECLKIVGDALKAKDAFVEALAWIKQNQTDAEQTEMKKKLVDCYKKNVEVKKPFTEKEYREVWKDFSIQKYSKELPGASDAICLKYSESRGRHYVATRDIRPGEIVLENRQYLIVVAREFRYQHCWMCGKFIANCVPCDTCNDVIFCSVNCKEVAWKSYHRLECERLSSLLNIPIEDTLSQRCHTMIVSAFRVLLLAINEYGTFKNLRKAVVEFEQSSDPRTKGFTNGQLLDDKYLAFYSLVPLDSSENPFIFQKINMIVAAIFDYATTTNLFGEKFKPDRKFSVDEDIIFAACSVIRHMDILSANSFEFAPYAFDLTHTGITLSIHESMFNHSCVCNVRFNNNPTYNAGIAMLPIKKGEELCITYFNGESAAERQKFSMQKYRFICDCIACKQNWPSQLEYPPLSANDPYKYGLVLQQALSNLPPTFDIKRASNLDHVRTIFSDRKFLTNVLKFYSNLIDKLVANKSLPCAEVGTGQDFILGLNNHLNNLIDVFD